MLLPSFFTGIFQTKCSKEHAIFLIFFYRDFSDKVFKRTCNILATKIRIVPSRKGTIEK